jgi:hypothetical protein
MPLSLLAKQIVIYYYQCLLPFNKLLNMSGSISQRIVPFSISKISKNLSFCHLCLSRTPVPIFQPVDQYPD